MDKQVQKLKPQPYYQKIYRDIISKKHPEKKEKCQVFLEKEELSALDIIKLNQIIFGNSNKEDSSFNQKHRSYDRETIFEILDHMKKNKLNNTQLADHFKISRNTIAKWKKIYLIFLAYRIFTTYKQKFLKDNFRNFNL